MSVLHVYAVAGAADAGLQPRAEGVGRTTVRLVEGAGLYALASELEAAPARTVENLRRHDEVVRAAYAASSALVPLGFGQTARDEAALRALLAQRATVLRAALARLAGCLQMNLRLLAAAGIESCVDSAGEASAGQDSAGESLGRDAGPGTQYLLARRRALEVPELATLRAALAGVVRAERVQATGGRGRSRAELVACYHLVRGADVVVWRQRVAATARELDRVSVAATGPFPPYVFASGDGAER